MKIIFRKWWDKETKQFSIINYKKAWKEVGNPPLLRFRTNGANKKNPKDSCLDVHFEIGYTVFNYTNFNMQRR
jgi:hypothetical protein